MRTVIGWIILTVDTVVIFLIRLMLSMLVAWARRILKRHGWPDPLNPLADGNGKGGNGKF